MWILPSEFDLCLKDVRPYPRDSLVGWGGGMGERTLDFAKHSKTFQSLVKIPSGTNQYPLNPQMRTFEGKYPHYSLAELVYYRLPTTRNKWNPPENNGPPPLTLGPEVQLCCCYP